MKIDAFDLRTNYRGGSSGFVSTGADAELMKISRMAGDMAAKWGQAADKAASREGREAGLKAAMGVEMPTVTATIQASPARAAEAMPGSDLSGTIAGLPAVAGAGKGFTDLRLPDGSLVRRQGTRAWRNNNPGNIEYGKFAKARGAIGSDGRFAVFASYEQGRAAKESLLFDAQSYQGKSIAQAVGRYAPPQENDTQAYINAVAAAVGVDPSTPMSDLSKAQRKAMLDAMERVEGFKPGTVNGMQAGLYQPGGSEIAHTVSGSWGALQLNPSGTIRADAYNAAATEAYRLRADTALRAQMDALAMQHENDPAAMAEAMAALKSGALAGMPADLQPEMAITFDRQAMSYQRQAMRSLAAMNEQRAAAAFEENMIVRRTSLQQLAARAGLDDAADEWIAGEMASMRAMIERSSLSPQEKARQLRSVDQEVTIARIDGAFANETTPEARKAFAARFQDDWRNGTGMAGALTADIADKLSSRFSAQIARDEAARAGEVKQVQGRVENLMSRLKKGHALPEAERAQIQAAVTAMGDPALADAWDFMSGLADWQAANRLARPDQLAAQIEEVKSGIARDGASERAIEALNVMETLHDDMKRGLDENPLGWADRTGLIELTRLDPSGPAELTASLQARRHEAETVSQWYGRNPVYFTPANRAVIRDRAESDPTFLPRFAVSIREAMGEATPAALAELSDEAPMLAHAAGLVMQTGQDHLLNEIGKAIELRSLPDYKPDLPTPARRQAATREVMGGALALLPRTSAAATATAQALFETRAHAQRLSSDDFDSPDAPGRAEWKQAVNQSLGARVIDGVQHGGIGSVNGLETLLPSSMSVDMAEQTLATINADDLGKLPAIVTANGVPIRPNRLRDARLVAIGGNRYRVALGDPASDAPRYVMGEDGYWTLDLVQLRKLQENRNAFSGSFFMEQMP